MNTEDVYDEGQR